MADAIRLLEPALGAWYDSGSHLSVPYWKSALAEAVALTGEISGALRLIEESEQQIVRPGWQERVWLPEVLRLKGWILSLKDDLEAAERSYLASLEAARHQKAKSWELRTSTSLARLWQSQGKRREAYDLLAPVYNWFTEGFDTHDLKAARALLDELH